jgi:hypothetical protein
LDRPSGSRGSKEVHERLWEIGRTGREFVILPICRDTDLRRAVKPARAQTRKSLRDRANLTHIMLMERRSAPTDCHIFEPVVVMIRFRRTPVSAENTKAGRGPPASNRLFGHPAEVPGRTETLRNQIFGPATRRVCRMAKDAQPLQRGMVARKRLGL